MHLVAKQIKGREYFYLIEKERRGARVVTSRTVYVGNRQKLADLVQQSASATLPASFAPQPIGAVLALATLADDLGVEAIIDAVCPVRQGAAPVGRRLVIAAIGRVVMPRRHNGLSNLRAFYEGTALPELLPIAPTSLDDRRMHELLVGVSTQQIEQIEGAVVRRLIEREGVTFVPPALTCARAKTPGSPCGPVAPVGPVAPSWPSSPS